MKSSNSCPAIVSAAKGILSVSDVFRAAVTILIIVFRVVSRQLRLRTRFLSASLNDCALLATDGLLFVIFEDMFDEFR